MHNDEIEQIIQNFFGAPRGGEPGFDELALLWPALGEPAPERAADEDQRKDVADEMVR
jgi:hypothetical protein